VNLTASNYKIVVLRATETTWPLVTVKAPTPIENIGTLVLEP